MPEMRPTTHVDDETLSSLLDDALPADAAAGARAHLMECDACGERWEGLVAVQAMLRALPPVAAPRDFALGPRLLVDPPNLVRLRRMERWSRGLAGVAAAMFLVVGGADLYTQMSAAPASAPAMPATAAKSSETAATPFAKPAPKPAAGAAAPAATRAAEAQPTTAPAAQAQRAAPPPAAPAAAPAAAKPAAAASPAAQPPAPAPAAAVQAGAPAPEAAPDAAVQASAEMQQAQSGATRALAPTPAATASPPSRPAPQQAAPAAAERATTSPFRPWLAVTGVFALSALLAALVLAWQVRRRSAIP